MGRHLGSFYLAGLLALCIASTAWASPTVAGAAEGGQALAAPANPADPHSALRDEAAMVLVGTALIGIGAAVRRATSA